MRGPREGLCESVAVKLAIRRKKFARRRDEERHPTLIADIGGFGVGSAPDLAVFPSGGFKMSKHSSMEFGWRFLDTGYETGDGSERFEYDMHLEGPVGARVQVLMNRIVDFDCGSCCGGQRSFPGAPRVAPKRQPAAGDFTG